MDKNEFQIGDVVKLKSDSVRLTVVKVDGHLIEGVYWNVEHSKIVNAGSWPYYLFIKVD